MAWRRRAPLHYAVRMERLDHPSAYPSFLPLIVGPANFPAVVEDLSVIVHGVLRLLAIGEEARPVTTPPRLSATHERASSMAGGVATQPWGTSPLSALYMIGNIN